MKYERLTTKDEEGNWTIWEDDYSHPFEALQVAIERLAELEDDLESGKIVRLPCKVGDTVWVITECYNSIKGKNNYFINKRKVEAIEFNERCFLLLCNDGGHYILGRRTFLTREEAEKKLKELQE